MISYVASGRDLLAPTKTRGETADFAIFANPDFGKQSNVEVASVDLLPVNRAICQREFRNFDLHPLAGTEREGEDLRAHAKAYGFTRVELHARGDASGAALRKEGSPARALARVQRQWLPRLRKEKGLMEACRLAGPFVVSFKGADRSELRCRPSDGQRV